MGSISVVFLLSHIIITIGITTAQVCNNTAGNFTTNSTYAKNRNLVLSFLASNMKANGGFYSATIGQDPNKVYARALCRGDSSATECSSCVNSTGQDLISKCPVQKNAISWGGVCGVRYAKRLILGVVELNPVVPICNVGEFPWNTGEFYQMWNSLMDQIVRKTSMGSSRLKFANGEANLTYVDSIYAQMQCTPDLSKSDCDYCLRKSVAQFETSCPGRPGGYIKFISSISQDS